MLIADNEYAAAGGARAYGETQQEAPVVWQVGIEEKGSEEAAHKNPRACQVEALLGHQPHNGTARPNTEI